MPETFYTFKDPTAATTSSQLQSIRNKATGTENAYDKTYTYTYDGNGNITGISQGQKTTTYVYDSANQLIRENNQAEGKTWIWDYDAAGNILSKKTYAYTTEAIGDDVIPADTVDYRYDEDGAWGDLLIEYDGEEIKYDAIGNPECIDGWSFEWKHGRELASMSKGGTTWTHTYNADGLRTKRTNGTTTYTYVYDGGTLVRMTENNNRLFFSHSPDGVPLAVVYKGVEYYYVTNAQGDVIALLDLTGNLAVEYTYDAWGNVLSITGPDADTIGRVNPLRYRGYVYDTETKLYYLQSRYYDPEMGRFVNADTFIATGQGFVGNNMFAYCNNNPSCYLDSTGTVPDSVLLKNAALYKAGGNVLMCGSNSLPVEGDPNSSQTLPNPDGTPKQKRWYGPDGKAKRDRDYNHGGDQPFPHDHEWSNGKRGEEHLPPSPEYKFSWEPIAGIGLVVVCSVGIAIIALDDATGIGIGDDFLLGPLGAGVSKGLIMIFV